MYKYLETLTQMWIFCVDTRMEWCTPKYWLYHAVGKWARQKWYVTENNLGGSDIDSSMTDLNRIGGIGKNGLTV